MKLIIILLFFTLSFAQIAVAYPENYLKECIIGIKQSPIVIGAPESELKQWCNCTLELILDKGNEDKSAAAYCGHMYFK